MRRLEFGILALAEVVAEVGFLMVALGLLYLDLPRWSLAGGLAARLGSHALTILSAEAYIPRGRPRRTALCELSSFAGSVFAGRVLCAVSGNADYVLVGRLLGTSALGFYGMAWDLLRFIPDRLYKVAVRVTTPAFCRAEHLAEDLQHAYLYLAECMSRGILPILACVAVAAPELLKHIYGHQWLPAAVPLRILTVGLTTVGLRAGIGSVYYSKGRPIFDLYLHGSRLALIVAAIFALAPGGLLAVSAGMSAVEMTISAAGQLIACWLLGLGLWRLCLTFVPGIKTAAVCAVATVIGKAVASALHVEGALELPLIALLPTAAFCWLEAATALQLIDHAFAPTLNPSQPAQETA